jgi:hypothetical protein
MKHLLTIAIIAVIAWLGYSRYHTQATRQDHDFAIADTPANDQTSATPSFICDGRTHCSQMTSCAEATFFLNNCPNTKMDGDRDGIPCEQQLCNQ